MTKNELYLEVAICAVGWGEGADFEMKELVDEDKQLVKAVEEHYSVKFPNEEMSDEEFEGMTDVEIHDHMTKEASKQDQAWTNALRTLQKETVSYLRSLKNS